MPEYEAREKAVRDYNAGMFEAEERGGERKAVRIALNMLSENFDVETISRISELPLQEVKRLKAQHPDPFYSDKNQSHLLAAKERMEKHGGTVHELIETDGAIDIPANSDT